MKIIGIKPTSTEVLWATVEGTREKPKLVPLDAIKQKFPKGQAEEETLNNLYKFAVTLLPSLGVDKVLILKAGSSKFGSASALRIKAEAMFQIACAEFNIPVVLIAPQGLRAQEKKFNNDTGSSPEDILNSGADFSPKPWKDAVLTAWIGLE